jgi:CDP-glycerol glycerophosphotransferase (TagB/SpsB family)
MKRSQIAAGIKYWAQILILPIYWLSFLFPRNQKIWLFGSTFGSRFAENPKYLYLYVAQNQSDEVRAIWISHEQSIITMLQEKGYEAYYYHSIKGMWYCLRGGYYIFDNYSKDICFWLSGGAIKVNLWHGSGNKKTNYDNTFDKIRHPKNIWERFRTYLRRISDEKPYHYTLATSTSMAKIYTSAFRTDRKHILINGQPRNDMLFLESKVKIKEVLLPQEMNDRKIIEQYHIEGYQILAYIPTFRDSEKEFFKVMDLAVFNTFLKNKKYILVTKLHPKSKLKKEFEEIQYSNIVNIQAQTDIYSFLGMVDLLITDYSSIYTDFMLLNRPVVAFHFDYKLYCANTRDSYIPFEEYMPEIKVVTMEELIEEIPRVLKEDIQLERRKISRQRMFDDIEGGYSEKMYHMIRKII